MLYESFIVAENEALVSKSGQSCLHERTTLLCAMADSTIVNMCEKIRAGDITMKELDKTAIPTIRKQMTKLCSAAGQCGIEEALEQRLSEANAFNRHKETLGLICDHIFDIYVKGECGNGMCLYFGFL